MSQSLIELRVLSGNAEFRCATDTMHNALHPDHMTAAERLDEVAEILAAGIIRLKARKSSGISVDRGDSCLDFTAPQRGHVSVNRRRKAP